MEIVLLLGFADAIFRRERSDDRKCVCASQAILRGIKKGMLTVKLWDDIFLQCFLTFFLVIPRRRQACLTKYWLDYQDQALLTDLCFVRRPLLFILDC